MGYTTQCGLEQEDIEKRSDAEIAFVVTLDGRGRLCSPTCQQAQVGQLADLKAQFEDIRRDCTDAMSVMEIDGPAGVTVALASALDSVWQSCSSSALRSADCDCDFTWNSFQ